MGGTRGGTRRIRASAWGFVLSLSLLGCESNGGFGPGGAPAAPLALEAFYFNRAVHLSWELGPGWDGEAFRIYAKRSTDQNYFLIAEVTNCSSGVCTYRDVNILPNVTYDYYVAAVGSNGVETASEFAIQVDVPQPTPPPIPGGIEAIALDRAIFLTWDTQSRSAEDFAFYRVYFFNGTAGTLIGETDSEGFLDLLVANGDTYEYFVSAVDDLGHESEGTELAAGTPRPDFQGEFLFAFEDRPADSGFRFPEDDVTNPVLHGTDPLRDFRLESDADGWWLVPGPEAEVHPNAVLTTALRCGPAADTGCVDVPEAPASGYGTGEVGLVPERSYVIRVPAGGAAWHYGIIRVTHVGFAEEGAFMVFDWAFQLQPGNRDLVSPAP
jgi:hypothetical protein